MQQPSEQVQESRASGVDETTITKEQLASAVASLSLSVNEFVSIAKEILVESARIREGNKNA